MQHKPHGTASRRCQGEGEERPGSARIFREGSLGLPVFMFNSWKGAADLGSGRDHRKM